MTLLLVVALALLVLAVVACVLWRRARRVASKPVAAEYVVRETHHY